MTKRKKSTVLYTYLSHEGAAFITKLAKKHKASKSSIVESLIYACKRGEHPTFYSGNRATLAKVQDVKNRLFSPSGKDQS